MSKHTFKKTIATIAASTLIATYGFVATASAESKQKVTFNLSQKSAIIQQLSETFEDFVQTANLKMNVGPLHLIIAKGQLTLKLPELVQQPTAKPTTQPTTQPTAKPTAQPTAKPSTQPTAKPTTQPTAKPTTQPTAKPTTQPVDASEVQKAVLSLVNKERAAAGLAALVLDTKLNEVATAKAKDMDDNNYFSHTSPTYGSPFDMLKTFGVSYRTAGENIATGQRSAEQVMNDWMNSSGHRANILNANYTKLGVGFVNGKWVQMFIG